MPTRRLMIGAFAVAAGMRAGLAGEPAAPVARPGGAIRPSRRAIRVLATTDRPIAQPLIDAFERRHPEYAVDYEQAGSSEIYQRIVTTDATVADVVWSSAMDLQLKLANDGFALAYRSPHLDRIPAWAVWRHEAYATTWEPVGFAYDRARLDAGRLPRTHQALIELLGDPAAPLRDRVASYDIERSGIGFLLATEDLATAAGAWALPRALGRSLARFHDDTRSMLDALTRGESLIAHNALGSYVEAYARDHPGIGIVYPSDYTLIMSRVALILRQPREPVGARLWLDFMLSAEGQQQLGQAGRLRSIRLDAPEADSTAALASQLRGAARPIALGPGLLANLDRSKVEVIRRRWHREYAAGQAEARQVRQVR